MYRPSSSFIHTELPARPPSQDNKSPMCRRDYRLHKCGCKNWSPISYCPNAPFNPQTRRRSMCNRVTSNRITVASTSGQLCGEDECYLEDLKKEGWTCCVCGEEGNRMDECVGPPNGSMTCDHEVCTECDYS